MSVDCLEHFSHQLHFGSRSKRENIAVKVDSASLVFGLNEHVTHCLQHIKVFVANYQFNPIQITATHPLEETDPAGIAFFHTSCCTKNLVVTIHVDRNCYQNGHIFKLSVPAVAQINSIHIDIRISPALQRTVPLILNSDVCFLHGALDEL